VTPNLSFKVTVYFKGEYLANGESDALPCLVETRVFGVGGSNGAIFGSIKFKQGWGGENMVCLLCYSLMHQYFENGMRYTKVTISD